MQLLGTHFGQFGDEGLHVRPLRPRRITSNETDAKPAANDIEVSIFRADVYGKLRMPQGVPVTQEFFDRLQLATVLKP